MAIIPVQNFSTSKHNLNPFYLGNLSVMPPVQNTRFIKHIEGAFDRNKNLIENAKKEVNKITEEYIQKFSIETRGKNSSDAKNGLDDIEKISEKSKKNIKEKKGKPESQDDNNKGTSQTFVSATEYYDSGSNWLDKC